MRRRPLSTLSRSRSCVPAPRRRAVGLGPRVTLLRLPVPALGPRHDRADALRTGGRFGGSNVQGPETQRAAPRRLVADSRGGGRGPAAGSDLLRRGAGGGGGG